MAKPKAKKYTPLPQPDPIDDDQLVDDLLAQLDSRNETVQEQSASVLNDMELDKRADAIDSAQKQDSNSRFRARKARKAAALAKSFAPVDPAADALLQKEADDEERTIRRVCDDLGFYIHQIEPDGHCLFSAIADQLALLAILPSSQANYATTRLAASTYIFRHKDDFLPFLPSEGEGNADGAGLMSPQQFEDYCIAVRDTGVWGGEPEIQALSRAYNIPIHVVQSGAPFVVIHNPPGSPDEGVVRVARISYHRRMYGLGEHYNSLRPKTGLSKITNAISSILG